jgi:hypothetical protein
VTNLLQKRRVVVTEIDNNKACKLQVAKRLTEAGVSVTEDDLYNCKALTYSALLQNSKLLGQLLGNRLCSV